MLHNEWRGGRFEPPHLCLRLQPGDMLPALSARRRRVSVWTSAIPQREQRLPSRTSARLETN
jgi:hypothetical protein